ncbi:MAG TPA: peptide-methionine (S)-S-oxide reductase MsrA [Gemmatimonadales bacterium]|nr:peptide-methionine (S)-S-oxide reductase MsrA [Gemmatimonadales bacterium]
MFKTVAARCLALAGSSSLALALVGLGRPRVETADPFVNATPAVTPASQDTAVFAGGCFWGIEGVFEHVKGVKSAVSGYSGGSTKSPTYEEVSEGNTGHAESVEVIYDPSKVTYQQLLDVFFTVAHDPTELNRQGPDVGTQYRSAIFYRDADQKQAAESYVAGLAQKKVYAKPIVTAIEPLKAFYPAEDYHQGYMAKHPDQSYIAYNDAPKVEHLKQQFPTLYRKP